MMSPKNVRPEWHWIAALVLASVAGLTVAMSGQQSSSGNSLHVPILSHGPQGPGELEGVVDDWSTHHLVFSNPGTEEEAIRADRHEQWLRIVNNPRYIMQQLKRRAPAQGPWAEYVERMNEKASAQDAAWGLELDERQMQDSERLAMAAKPVRPLRGMNRDWNMYLGAAAATVGAGQFPATFSSSTTLAYCGNATTPDFVVYNTSTAGNATSADGSGTVTIATDPSGWTTGANTVSVSGVTYTFVTGTPTAVNQVQINTTGGTAATRETDTAENLIAVITDTAGDCANTGCVHSGQVANPGVSATRSTNVVTLTAVEAGDFAISSNSANATVAITAGDTTGQPSILAYDNLYSGCTATNAGAPVPNVYWQYNANGGTVTTSPVVSLDGAQVAFVETIGSDAYLALLKPLEGSSAVGCTVQLINGSHAITGSVTSGSKTLTTTTGCFNPADVGATLTGTGVATGATISSVTNSATAVMSANASGTDSNVTITVADTNSTNGYVTPAEYHACTAPCMTAIEFAETTPYNGTLGLVNDTTSSPFYDYNSDDIYVGDANGFVHLFTTVFQGTPAETDTSAGSQSTPGWPVYLSAVAISNPIYDSTSGNIFVGPDVVSANNGGAFHRVPVSSASHANEVTLSTGLALGGSSGSVGFADGPIVDGAAGKLYAFVGDTPTGTNDAVWQFPTSYIASTTPVETKLGTGSAASILYSGTFDNSYYTSGSSPTGSLYVCGNTSAGLILYQVTITGNSMSTTATTGPTLTSATTTCSPITEFYSASKDYIFFSVEANGTVGVTGTACTGNCVYSFNVTSPFTISTSTKAANGMSSTGGSSGLVVDNALTSPAGASNIYFSPLGSQSCAGNGIGQGFGTGGCAMQASQSAL